MRDVAAGDAIVVDVARSALLETTEADTVGAVLGIEQPEDGVLEVRFGTSLPGYPGWAWTVGVSVIDGVDTPSVLEVGLLPADGALTAPEWVPWSDRLADYRAGQLATGEQEAEPGGEGGLFDDEDDDLDEADDADEVDDLDEEDLLPDEDDDLDGIDFEGLADDDRVDGPVHPAVGADASPGGAAGPGDVGR